MFRTFPLSVDPHYALGLTGFVMPAVGFKRLAKTFWSAQMRIEDAILVLLLQYRSHIRGDMELPHSIEFAGINWELSPDGGKYVRTGNQGPCAHLKFEEEGSGQRAVVETAACRLEGDWAFTIWGALVEIQRSGRVIWK